MVRQSFERPKVEGVNPYLIFASGRVPQRLADKSSSLKFSPTFKCWALLVRGLLSLISSTVGHLGDAGRCWREQHAGVAQEIETLCRHTIQRLIEMSTYGIYIHHDHQTPKGPAYRIQPLQLPPTYIYVALLLFTK